MSSLNGNYGVMCSTLGNSSGYDLNLSKGGQYLTAPAGGGGVGGTGAQQTITAERSKLN
jgi:hypothetical protein